MSAELMLPFDVEKSPTKVAELAVAVSPVGQTVDGVAIWELTTMLPVGTPVVGKVEG